jgi:hypothetical protein
MSNSYAHRGALLGLLTAAALAVGGIVFLPAGAAPARADSAGGETAAPTSSPAGWTPLYTQDFNTNAALGQFGNVYGSAWNGYSGVTDTSGKGTYEPNQVLSVHDSALDFYIHTSNGVHMVAAPLPNGYNGTTYGRYSIRYKTDVIPGYKIAFLMWPTSDNWNNGEIDYPESDLGGNTFYGASAIAGSYNNGNMSWDPSKPYTPTNASTWHVATTEWSPGSIKFYWDDALIGQTQNAAGVPTTPMRWTLQAETNLDGAVVPATSSGHLLVDWVKAWTYTPGSPAIGTQPTAPGAPVVGTGPWSKIVDNSTPLSHLDAITPGIGSVHLTGWAFSPTTTNPINVDVYVNGVGVRYTANTSRPDVDAAFGGSGNHGFDITIPTNGGGNKQVVSYAIGGSNPVIAVSNVSLPTGSPIGSLDTVTAAPGTISTTGWTLDPDTTASIPADVYVDNSGVRYSASDARNDIASAFPGYGAAHGFHSTVAASAGAHTVCAYGINESGAGGNSLLACKTVVVPGGAPIGYLDSVTAGKGKLTAAGWSLDPDTAASIRVDVYVDGVGKASGTAGLSRPDIAAAFPGYGASHGYSDTISIPAGYHTVCSYGINAAGSGGNALLGCTGVTVG